MTLAFIVALAGAIILAVLGTTPPAPRAAPDGFSADAAMRDIRRIARAPHPSGSAEHAALRDWLVGRLDGLGMEVRLQRGTFPPDAVRFLNARSGGKAASIPLTNIIAVLPGSDRSLPTVALMAHYDSVAGSPAAADDGAGVAAILAVAERLAAQEQGRRDLLVILTDGEEAGLSGVRLFFAEADERERIGALINLETRGGGGKANLFQTSADNGEVVRTWARSVPHPGGTSLATFIYSVLPNDTDLTVALPLGFPAWNFAFIGRPGLYHSPLATADNLDRGALQHMGEQALGLTRALVDAERLPQPAPDVVFFDVFGLFVVSYAPYWGWVMLAVGTAGFVWSARRGFDWRAFCAAAGWLVAILAGTGLVLAAVNWLSMGGDAPNYYDRLAAIPRLQAMAALVCLGGLALLASRSFASASRQLGFVLPIGLSAMALQALAPLAAYVLTIPLLLCGLAAAARTSLPAIGIVLSVVAGALVGGYALMLGFALMQAVGPTLPAVCLLSMALTAMALMPLAPVWPMRRAGAAYLVLTLGAVAIALWVRLDPIAPSVPGYAVNEQRASRWALTRKRVSRPSWARPRDALQDRS
ncbi:hypothetical protein B2G71_18930 [Novosphingobium sp. PC22D]|uniref:M28 family peptidase n=1 Tax=Novosphingobium sp. PC22D TaxID=1962403 RepID=UPI000BFAB6E3|nr:M28 family peptidase [Novosphingobium sp. PC22D]PEQ11114.1 hypothetical protein B2G71_18930 [Novosphingobium sp. PC22D]